MPVLSSKRKYTLLFLQVKTDLEKSTTPQEDDCVNNPQSLQENLPINFGLNKQKEAGPNPLATGPLWNRGDQVGVHRTFSSSE